MRPLAFTLIVLLLLGVGALGATGGKCKILGFFISFRVVKSVLGGDFDLERPLRLDSVEIALLDPTIAEF